MFRKSISGYIYYFSVSFIPLRCNGYVAERTMMQLALLEACVEFVLTRME